MDKAKEALKKKASFGSDIDLDQFQVEQSGEHSYQEDLFRIFRR